MPRLAAIVLLALPPHGGSITFAATVLPQVELSAAIVTLGDDRWLEVRAPERATAYVPEGVRKITVHVGAHSIDSVTTEGGELAWFVPPGGEASVR